jgi:hypothetical protein
MIKLLLIFLPLTCFSAPSKNAPLKDSDIKTRDYMVELSRQIGVTCTHCHDLKDFKKSDKPAYKLGQTHIEMVAMLNEKYAGKVGEKVDCYMCHRGQPKWDYQEKKPLGH